MAPQVISEAGCRRQKVAKRRMNVMRPVLGEGEVSLWGGAFRG